MKKILLAIFTTLIFIFSSTTSVSAAVTPRALIEFDKITYKKDDIIHLKIHAFDFADLYGFQVDIKENTAVFSIPDNTLTPYTVDVLSILGGGHEWLNTKSNQIASIIYTVQTGAIIGTDFNQNSLLVEIDLVANASITDIYEEFNVSADFDDLEFGDANIIVKLSDSLGDPIVYEYYVDTTPPVLSGYTNHTVDEDTTIPDVITDVIAVDDFDSRLLTVESDILSVIDINTPGDYIVTLSATDIFGNVGTQQITVTVNDITPPSFSGPLSIELQIGDEIPNFKTLVTVVDNKDGVITLVDEHVDSTNVNFNAVGDYQVYYTVLDEAGNEGIFSIDVKIIEKIEVASIVISTANLEVNNHATGTVEFTVLPVEALNIEVEITTYDSSIVSIDQDGNFIALKSGQVTITIKSLDTQVEDQITITVLLVTPKFTLNPSLDTVYVGVNWFDPGCKATLSGVENDCTVDSNNVTNTAGTYEVVYSYSDSDGVKRTVTRKVKVVEVPAVNELKLNAGIDTILKDSEWIDAGCTPNCIVLSNNVDTSKTGTYEVIYQKNNDSSTTITRYVNVYTNAGTGSVLAIIERKKEGEFYA